MKGKGTFFLFCEITYSMIFQRVLRLVTNSHGSLKSSRICMCTNSERAERNPFMEQITIFMKISVVQFMPFFLKIIIFEIVQAERVDCKVFFFFKDRENDMPGDR